MARPVKPRKICKLPGIQEFSPHKSQNAEKIIMTLDEYETLRLLDLEELTQEEAAAQMEIARTTVTAIYRSARRKLADILVNGKHLVIEGGEYTLCNENSAQGCSRKCGCGCQDKKR